MEWLFFRNLTMTRFLGDVFFKFDGSLEPKREKTSPLRGLYFLEHDIYL